MGNKIPSKAGEKISKKLAKELHENFKKNFKVKNKSMYYSRDVFERLLGLSGSVGVRIYPGLEDDNFTPVLVAVDADGNNIYYDSTKFPTVAEEDPTSSAIEERGATCPPYCPENDL